MNLFIKALLGTAAYILTIMSLTLIKARHLYLFIALIAFTVWLFVPNKYFYIEVHKIRSRK